MLRQEDLLGALEVIRPLSRSGTEELAVGSVTLDDVGDMAATKQALTEAVLWPLRHPDSFARLGVDPPRGVLLYGPPGCGKTFLVRALASTGQLSVHAVKGAELMDKWVGASEKAVANCSSAPGIRRRRWCFSTRSTRSRRGAGRAATPVSATAWSRRCSPNSTASSRCVTSSCSVQRTGPS